MLPFDRKGARAAWADARKAETAYNTRLRQVAVQVGSLVSTMAPKGFVRDLQAIMGILDRYATMLEPWAGAAAEYMMRDVERRNERLWRKNGNDISKAIRTEVLHSSQGVQFRRMMDEQVDLIQSIPRDAAQRVHDITTGALYSGKRPEEIAQQIMRQRDVSISKARLIARTEVSRTAATFMQARAMAAGSEGYIWRTSKDADVRDTHKAMEGRYVRWDTPPKTDASLDPYHAGCGPNCRCFAEPVLPDL